MDELSKTNAEITLDIHEGVPVTSSKTVAFIFDKRHDHVLRDINEIICQSDPSCGVAMDEWFIEGKEPDAQGKLRKIYYMTRDGFSLLAMGFTGKKALQFKIAYINAFNALEEQLHGTPDQKDIKALDNDISIVKAAGILADVLVKSFNVNENIAKTVALDLVEDRFARDYSRIKACLPPSTPITLMTPTEIGREMGINNPHTINIWLEHCDLQVNLDGKWRPTSAGKQFSMSVPYTSKRGKHSDFQLKWRSDVINYLREHPML